MFEICPVCGNSIKKSSAVFTSNFRGKTYYFHNAKEKKGFDNCPSKYIKKTA